MDENSNGGQLKSSLDTTVKLSAVAISIGFVLSITYDYGYFMAFELSFSDIPSTINDHIRNSLICLPYSAGIIAMWLAVKFVGDIKDHVKSLSINTAKKAKTSVLNTFANNSYAYLIVATFMIGIISYILLGNKITLSFYMLWFYFVYFELIWVIILKVYDLTKLSRQSVFLIIFVPIFLSLMLLKGNEISKEDMSRKAVIGKIYLKNNSIIDASSIRFFERFVFVVLPTSKHPMFIQWAEIFKVEQVANKNVGFAGLLDYFGYELQKGGGRNH